MLPSDPGRDKKSFAGQLGAPDCDFLEPPEKPIRMRWRTYDPGEGVNWSFVRETAFRLRDPLKIEGHDSWPKLTGGKGLHVMVPIERTITHDQAHAYCKRLAQRLAATEPNRYTTSAALAKRSGRLFIDYLRNGRGTTAIGTYSPRARPGFPIAAPVTWKQLERGVRPDVFQQSSAGLLYSDNLKIL